MRIYLAVLPVAALLLAGCGTSAPPTAAQLARRVPHCRKDSYQEPPSSYATSEETCTDIWGTQYDFATFANEGDMHTWENQGRGYTCCVQGNLWAVSVIPWDTGSAEPYFKTVIKADGGHEVSVP